MLQCFSWILGASFSQETRALAIAVVVVRALSYAEGHRHFEARSQHSFLRFTAPEWHAAAEARPRAFLQTLISGARRPAQGWQHAAACSYTNAPRHLRRSVLFFGLKGAFLWGLGKAGFRSRVRSVSPQTAFFADGLPAPTPLCHN